MPKFLVRANSNERWRFESPTNSDHNWLEGYEVEAHTPAGAVIKATKAHRYGSGWKNLSAFREGIEYGMYPMKCSALTFLDAPIDALMIMGR